jgi:hypothetical protein
MINEIFNLVNSMKQILEKNKLSGLSYPEVITIEKYDLESSGISSSKMFSTTSSFSSCMRMCCCMCK